MLKIISLLFFFASLEGAAKFVVLSPPKCGTHLITKALALLLDKKETCWLGDMPPNPIQQTERITREGGFAVAHNWDLSTLLELVNRGYKIVFLVRDPRDHAISVLSWSYSPNWGGPRGPLEIAKPEERLTELIIGRKGWCCYEYIRSRLNILELIPRRCCFIARFENLVGQKGGGTKQAQLKELRSLCQFLGHPCSEEKITQVADQLWGNSPTFRVGKIGEWKKIMTPYQIQLYKTFYQEELEYLKYEKNKRWD